MISINQMTHVLPFLLMLMLFIPTLAMASLAFTSSGILQGIQENAPTGTITKFLGIPYAQPPIGDLRFKPPQPLEDKAANSMVDADQFKASCMQSAHLKEVMYPHLRGDERSVFFDDDCLFLNVFVPGRYNISNTYRVNNSYTKVKDICKQEKGANHKPIMIWLPGEGYNFASSAQYDMSALATAGNVIVVTVNYRVSLFGFLSTGDEEIPGNMGLLDQLAAIRWIKTNAKAFGGNPNCLTVFGRFTGSTSISALLVSPLSKPNNKPLFHRAIMQSGIAGESWIIDRNPADGFKRAAEKTNCLLPGSTTKEIVECLRKVPAKRLLDVCNFIHSWRLVLNNETLPDEPLNVIIKGDHLPIPVMLGGPNDDGSLCLLTYYFMNRTLYERIINDEINENDFRKLARDFLLTYVGKVEDDVVDKIDQRDSLFEYVKKAEDDLVDKIVRRYSLLSNKKSWTRRYIKMCGDGCFRIKTQAIAEQLSLNGSRVFLYQFSHRPSQSFHPKFLDAAFGDDVLFSLGLVQQSSGWTSEEYELSKIMTKAWTNFAKYGDPKLKSSKKWPSYSEDRENYWDFSLRKKSKVKNVTSSWSLYNFWQQILDILNHRRITIKLMKLTFKLWESFL